MDQGPDDLLDIVLRMDSGTGGSLLTAASFQDVSELSADRPCLPPVYADLSGGTFDGLETEVTVPPLADLSGLLDIDSFPQVPFSPDAACLPHQNGGASESWSSVVYLNSPASLQQSRPCPSVPQTATTLMRTIPPHCQPSSEPSVISANQGAFPALQFVSAKCHQQQPPGGHGHPQLGSMHPQPRQPAVKPRPRRRVTTASQRKAANVRERRRMFNLNEAFDVLRKTVPTFAHEKRMSRIETLRLAMLYIAFMWDVVSGKTSEEGQLVSMLESGNFAGLTSSNRPGTKNGATAPLRNGRAAAGAAESVDDL